MTTSPAYRLVLFDFDGTLADSAGWFGGVLNGVARRFRFREVDCAELEAMRGEDTRAMLRRLGVARWKLPFIARHMRRLMARDIDQIALFTGTAGLIETLDGSGVTIAVVSSNAEANVRRVLGPDLAARIDLYACGSSLFGKAAKIRRLVERCGVPPSAVLAIGDEIRDIDAAGAAGVACGAVSWGYASAGALAERKPAWVFDDVAAIIVAVLPSPVGGTRRSP